MISTFGANKRGGSVWIGGNLGGSGCGGSVESVQAQMAVVFVDLGNIHDLLQPLDELQGGFKVYAFPDKKFNGYGVSPSPKSENIHVVEAGNHKKSNAIRLIYTITTMWARGEIREAHVVSKDKMVHELVDLGKKHKCRVYIYTSKEDFINGISRTIDASEFPS
tara:strand:- start:99 stop:590 length:492 start_codon:yes stop_codon:yes gene_type:complete